ncbi:methyltransferase domain-containing protein [Halomonas denitrificans]|nr:methyltransferase domain-containing protein [Halomonas denitrificans]
MADDDIKQMKLYQHVERVERALADRGLAPPAPLRPEQIEDLDHLHYEGRDSVDLASKRLGLTRDHRVLDVGSGLGGPARRLATVPGCRVVALELQRDLHECASSLTSRCGLDDRIRHVHGDILDAEAVDGPFDALVSWLVFLHIPDRPALLRRCRALLEPGGGLHAEDFYLRRPLHDDEKALLRNEVQCAHLVDRTTYIDELESAGFGDIRFDDCTEDWRRFVGDRARDFRSDAEPFIALHGRAAFEALSSFYATMVRLFDGGRLGGVRVTARAK